MGILSEKKKTNTQAPQDLRVRFDSIISENKSFSKTKPMNEYMKKLGELQTKRIIEQEEKYAKMRDELGVKADHWVEILSQKEDELTLAAQKERDKELLAFSDQNTAEIKKIVEADKYRYVFEQRKSQFEEKNPELHREDFASEEEYKASLIEQYKSVRRDEYEALCYDRGVNFYNDSKDIIIAKKDFDIMDEFMWQSEECMRRQVSKQDISISPDSTAFHSQYVSTRLTNSDGTNNGHYESCAVSSCALVHDICNKFGMSEDDNPIKGEGNTISGIVGANGASYGECPCPNGSGTFKNLLENGKIGVGDRISFKTKADATNTTTGFHQRTVIAVEKDAEGKIIGYTLQANNPCELSYHKINDANDECNKEIIKYSSTSQYIDQQINKESNQMQNMSIEQIEQQLAETKRRTVGIYENTSLNVEKKFLENPLSPKNAGYNRDGKRRADQCKRESIFTKHYTDIHVNKVIQAEVAAQTERYAETLTPIDKIVNAKMAEFKLNSQEFRNFEHQAMICGFEHSIFNYDISQNKDNSIDETRETMKKDRSDASNLAFQLVQATEPVYDENAKQENNKIAAIVRNQRGKTI